MARKQAFKDKIERFNMIYLDMLHQQWTNHRLWSYRMQHDRRSADQIAEEMIFWGLWEVN